jgi:hypothetical protein
MRTCSKREGSNIAHSMPWKVSSILKLSVIFPWLHSTSNILTASDTTTAGCIRIGVISIRLESSLKVEVQS